MRRSLLVYSDDGLQMPEAYPGWLIYALSLGLLKWEACKYAILVQMSLKRQWCKCEVSKTLVRLISFPEEHGFLLLEYNEILLDVVSTLVLEGVLDHFGDLAVPGGFGSYCVCRCVLAVKWDYLSLVRRMDWDPGAYFGIVFGIVLWASAGLLAAAASMGELSLLCKCCKSDIVVLPGPGIMLV
ncbi:hypothetical protein Nepgr_032615 [Nepenthes gracilis]|uniref:Uncharacterized protein n=1 Tax=Nepenthes gracilis TaxID=150966 RepID=A0AAD3TJS9_NEPGR|nr:hypothetical protein Nepgr_032615 [Nepenthes gracilis]